MPTDPLSTNHLRMPDDFEFASYEAVHSRIGPLHGSYPASWPEYASAWTAIAHRFYACAEYDESFTESFRTYGGAPEPIERQRQERDLYGFFVSGLSAIESFCYGLFAIASMQDAMNFPIISAQDKRLIKPRRTAQRFASSFPREDVTKALEDLVNDQNHDEWKDMRNVLAHRSSPGRHLSVTISEGQEAERRTSRWGTIPLDVHTTPSRCRWLAESLRSLLSAANTFTANHF